MFKQSQQFLMYILLFYLFGECLENLTHAPSTAKYARWWGTALEFYKLCFHPERMTKKVWHLEDVFIEIDQLLDNMSLMLSMGIFPTHISKRNNSVEEYCRQSNEFSPTSDYFVIGSNTLLSELKCNNFHNSAEQMCLCIRLTTVRNIAILLRKSWYC